MFVVLLCCYVNLWQVTPHGVNGFAGVCLRVQIEWHPMCWVPDLIPYAEKHNITLQAYSSLGSGENRLMEHEVVKQVRTSKTFEVEVNDSWARWGDIVH